MKKSNNFLFIALLASILMFGNGAFAQQDTDSTAAIDYASSTSVKPSQLWDQANTQYVNGNFKGAIADYNKILDAGSTSSQLHYNLANAYYKDGQIANAILNYRRAQLLSPSDNDIEYNLEIAKAQVKDKIEEVPVIFVIRALSNLRSSLSSNAWAMLAFILFTMTAILILIYLLASGNRIRKVGFIGGLVSLVLFFVTISFSFSQRKVVILEKEAVIMSSAVSVKSSPDKGSKDIFILHAGTIVEISSTLGEWSEIVIADGNKGWLHNDAYQKISLAE
ncbi:MAG: tetratricopeptide repeat protein [Rikenellaceae bacterium]